MNYQNAQFEDIYVNERLFFSDKPAPQFRRILITGAQGMVGNAVSCTLRNLRLIGVLNYSELILSSRNWANSSYSENWAYPGIRLISNSELDEIGKVDLVIHTASPSNITRIESMNQLRQANSGLLNSIRNLHPERIVYLSSGEVYKGENIDEGLSATNFSEREKRDWYPIAKLEVEHTLRDLVSNGECSAQVIRLFHTYGPGIRFDDGRSFAEILWGAVSNGVIILRSSGIQVRSFLYLGDAVSGILSAGLSSNQGFQILNLGSDIPVSILEFAQITARITNSEVAIKEDTNYLHSPNEYLVPKLGRVSNYGWGPQVDLESGIIRTTNWIRNLILESK